MGKTLKERILYPADSHKPGLRAGKEAVKVRKIVGKVRV